MKKCVCVCGGWGGGSEQNFQMTSPSWRQDLVAAVV